MYVNYKYHCRKDDNQCQKIKNMYLFSYLMVKWAWILLASVCEKESFLSVYDHIEYMIILIFYFYIVKINVYFTFIHVHST